MKTAMNQSLTRLAALTDEADLICSPRSAGQSAEATLQYFANAGCSSLGSSLFGLAVRATSDTTRRTENSTKHRPVLVRVQFFAANLSIENALNLSALRDVADDAELFPVRDRLLCDADQVGELGLCASELNRALDSGLIRGRGAHGSLVSDYKRICSTGRARLQAHLKALDTKSFV